uniref:Uncharacterized protein n=1 Tax=Fagus sylvatica TaxID=28930 RepID=A0A2N9IIZ0_FAGSY
MGNSLTEPHSLALGDVKRMFKFMILMIKRKDVILDLIEAFRLKQREASTPRDDYVLCQINRVRGKTETVEDNALKPVEPDVLTSVEDNALKPKPVTINHVDYLH